MVVKFTELAKTSKLATHLRTPDSEFILRDIFINPEHVVCVQEDLSSLSLLGENRLPENLNKNHRFTNISVQHGHAGMYIVVIGDPNEVQKKLQGTELLNG